MIPESHNFNLPFEVTELERILEGRGEEDEEGNINLLTVKKEGIEYTGRLAILWEDIIGIKDFTYVDDWKIKGPKCLLTTRDTNQDILILGDYDHMLEYWTEYRRRKGQNEV